MKAAANWRGSLLQFWQLMADQQKRMGWALLAGLLNSGLNLLAPFLLGYGIDHFIQSKQYPGLFRLSAVLLGVYLLSLGAHYTQMILMGSVGQNVLFLLRERIFSQLQALPVAFFNQHKAGDLISRINNDTDKLNQFLSESLVRFMGSLFIMSGAGIAVLVLHPRLGLVALAPSLLLLLWTRLLSGWVKKQNAQQLEKTGQLSATIQENLSHFKELLVFDRRDYFRSHFADHNQKNYQAAMGAGLANGIFGPIFDLHYNLAHLGVLGYGLWLFQKGELSLGLLISFLTYVNRYYDPLRQMALLWSSFQLALASWERISAVLDASENLDILPPGPIQAEAGLLSFKDVCFHYPGGAEVLHHVSFTLEPGKTYALVGPTGGGKSTTAALMARLYDPISGQVTFQGRDLREFSAAERSQKMGYILQEPFLF
ncbi:MAG: ABC transporter ATP-binding protein, partial [Candidatus Sericytochromatia bacterium]